MVSLTAFGGCPKRPDVPAELAVCPSSAFIDEKEYELQDLHSNSDKEFHAWAADAIGKYPELKNAYHDLRQCWDYYHKKKAP